MNHILRNILVLLSLIACTSPETGTSHSFNIYEENGVTIAETTGGPKYEGELFEYVPVLELESGDTDETMLFNPTTFIADSEGWFYINDAGNGDVVVFDPEGRFHNRFGRKGAGPGEFQRAQFLCTIDDMLYIYDSSQRRTTWFRRSGELVDMVSIQRIPPFLRMTALLPLPGSDRLLLSIGGDTPVPGGSEGEGVSWCNALRLTAVGDTVWSWNSEPIKNSYQLSMTIGGLAITQSTRFPYSPLSPPRVYYVPDLGVVALSGYAPQVDIIGLDGQLHRRIRIELGDLTVTEKDRLAVFEMYDQMYDQMIEDAPMDQYREFMKVMREGLQFGDLKAPWTSLKYDDRGYLYLTPRMSFAASPDTAETIGWMVISPDGEYLGNTKPPAGRTEVIGGRLLVNHSDSETGEFTLTVYDIRPIVEGLKYP